MYYIKQNLTGVFIKCSMVCMDTNPTAQSNPIPVAQPAQGTPPTINPVGQPAQPPLSSKKSGSSIFMVAILIILVICIVGVFGSLLFLNSNKANVAKVYPTPATIQSPTVTPTPAAEINSKDTTNDSLDKDSSTLDKNINSLDTDVNNVDSGFSDQQPNLE